MDLLVCGSWSWGEPRLGLSLLASSIFTVVLAVSISLGVSFDNWCFH
jgi:hypothetical protein